MARDIFTNPDIMMLIREITSSEEHKFSDIPGWQGGYMAVSALAVLLWFPDREADKDRYWFPFSQLRKAEDNQSIYASNWIISKCDLA
jgi:hypothetical protein